MTKLTDQQMLSLVASVTNAWQAYNDAHDEALAAKKKSEEADLAARYALEDAREWGAKLEYAIGQRT